jgi:hypothetical protein
MIDDTDFYSYGFNDIQARNIISHEFGHTLGLFNIGYQYAENNHIYSIMVDSVIGSPNFSGHPTAEFDIPNLKLIYL